MSDIKRQPQQRLHDKHVSLEIVECVKSICAPLFSTTDVNYFHYGRVYPNGYSLVLVSHPEFHKFFWQQQYDKVVFPNYQAGLFINKCDNNILQEAKEYFNLDHWLMVNKDKNEYLESFGFGTYSGNDKIIEYYLNNQDVLEQFGLYFKEQAKNLISASEKSLLYTENVDLTKKETKNDSANDGVALLNKLLVGKKYLVENSSEQIVKITKLEFTIMHYVSLGLSAKEIGKLMGVSFRTVEAHFSTLKLKLQAKNKADIIRKYASLSRANLSFADERIKDIFVD